MRKAWRLGTTVVIAYMVYNNVQMLMQMPVEQWALSQWLMVLVSVGLVAAGGLLLWQLWQDRKKDKAEEAQQTAEKWEKLEMCEQNDTDEDLIDVPDNSSMSDAEGRAMERELQALDELDGIDKKESIADVSDEKREDE